MDAMLGLVGFISFIVGICMFITACIKKSNKKISKIVIVCGIVLFIIGVMMPSSIENVPVEDNQTIENNITESLAPTPETTAISTTTPTVEPTIVPTPEPAKIQTKDQALEAFTEYITNDYLTYEKFDVIDEDENTFYIFAGFDNGRNWDEYGDLYHINKQNGTIEYVETVDDRNEVEKINKSFSYNGFYAYELKIVDGLFGRYIKGYIKNETSHTADIVITFNYYTEGNIQSGSENIVIQQLAPGGIAEVSAYNAPADMIDFDIVSIEEPSALNVITFE